MILYTHLRNTLIVEIKSVNGNLFKKISKSTRAVATNALGGEQKNTVPNCDDDQTGIN